MSWTPDAPSTEEVLQAVLSSTLTPLPPQESYVGATTVSWWETTPGEVYIHAQGGTTDDRHYASTLMAIQLEGHGYRRAQFDMDRDDQHLDSGRISSQAPEPPNYRKATTEDRCGGCKMFDQGICWGFGNKEVEADHVCDEFAPEIRTRTEAALHQSSWVDVMAKAKRLVQSGQVHVLRNGFNYVVGHVVGDHGEYDCEFSRDDPSSRSITGWSCSCPWDQYAWQRTRKWKKFEGRPCAHLTALMWKSLATPLDEQLTQEQAEALGTGQKLPAPGVPDHAEPPAPTHGLEHAPEELPRSFGPEGPIQGDQQQLNLPPDALGHPPGPAQAPLAPPPGQGPTAPGILPPFPGEQMEMPWGGPGSTPGGGVSPPGAFTVPGAKPQTPANPLQNPSTYSHVKKRADLKDIGDYITTNEGYTFEVIDTTEDPYVGLTYIVRSDLDGNDMARSEGEEGRDWQYVYIPASDIRQSKTAASSANLPRTDVGPWGGSLESAGGHWCTGGGCVAMAAAMQHEWPHLGIKARYYDDHGRKAIDHAYAYDGQRSYDLFGNEGYFDPSDQDVTIDELMRDHPDMLEPWMIADARDTAMDMYHPEHYWEGADQADSSSDDDRDYWHSAFRTKTSADFQSPQVIRLKNNVVGLAEGPVKGQYGDGEYREVPAGTPGEVLSQDPTTGWVEVILPLDDSGNHEPFHVRCFLEPSDIEPTDQTNAFIRRKTNLKDD